MTEQLNLDALAVDPAAAEAAAQDGMGKAWSAYRVQVWKADASAWLAAQQPGFEFVADDLVAEIGLPDSGPSKNNVVGAWFSAQSRRGRIEFAQRLRRSGRVVRHGNLQRVWVVR